MGKSENYDHIDVGDTSFVSLMSELYNIRGYKASSIMTFDGEILYSNANGAGNKLNLMMPAYNSLFEQACISTEQSGFGSCREASLKTGDDDMLVIRCSGQDCLVGIRLLVLVETGGNVSMTQRKLDQILPLIMKCMVWEPDNLTPLYMKEFFGAKKSVSNAQAEFVQ